MYTTRPETSPHRAGEVLASLGLRGGNRKSATKNNGAILDDLGISTQQSARWQREAAVPEEAFLQYLDEAAGATRELTSAGLLRLAHTLRSTAGPRSNGRVPFERLARSLRSIAGQGETFGCIFAAPPRAKKMGFPTIAKGLVGLPVKEVAAREAHLHLWTVPEALAEAIKVLKVWGFRYQTSLVWSKTPERYGEYWRPAHETVLLSVRGKLPFRDSNLPSCVDGQLTSPARESSHNATNDM